MRVDGRRPPPRPRGPAGIALVPEDEAVPPAHRPAARALRAACTASRPRRCPTGASTRSGCSTWPTGRWAGSARACASGPRWPRPGDRPVGAGARRAAERRRPGPARALIDLFQALGAQGRTVIVSSHVLNEVERLAGPAVVVIRGRLAAAGDHRRHPRRDGRPAPLGQRPHAGARALAARLIGHDLGPGRHRRGHDASWCRRSAPASWPGCRSSHAEAVRPVARGTSARRLARERVPGAAAVSPSSPPGGRSARRLRAPGRPGRLPPPLPRSHPPGRRGRPADTGPYRRLGLPAAPRKPPCRAPSDARLPHPPPLRGSWSATRCGRACPARRWLGVLLPCLAARFGWLGTLADMTRRGGVRGRGEQGLFGLVLPLTCLVIGDAVLGADLRAGTFAFTWLSPAPSPDRHPRPPSSLAEGNAPGEFTPMNTTCSAVTSSVV